MCPERGQICVDDPNDNCDPAAGAGAHVDLELRPVRRPLVRPDLRKHLPKYLVELISRCWHEDAVWRGADAWPIGAFDSMRLC